EENPFEPYHVTEEFRLHALNPQGEEKEFLVKGRLLGGCLDSLATLCGTRFDKVREFNKRYEEDGVLWFLEACDLNIMGIRRALWQLKNAGWFDTARGFLIGRPYCFGEEGFGIDQYTAVTDVLSELQVPIIMDLDIGHLPPMMPLVCGSLAKAEIRENSISIMMEYK
ncbi:MAG: LD-carboxypeptidase, partial [Eubacterium sp.]|nr:LD-carboxypeptidase [Eubacterium sp.]